MSLFRGEKLVQCISYGVTDGSSAQSGVLGEVIESLVASGSAVALTTATPANVTSISLSAGDWDIDGHVVFAGASATTAAGDLFSTGISTTSATLPTDGSEQPVGVPAVTTTSFKAGTSLIKKTISLSGAATVYLVAEATFSAGTMGAYGSIVARRVR